MAFRFSLATLLRMREIAEQREERLLGQILNQMAQTRQTLADLDTQRKNLITNREHSLQATTSSVDLQGFYTQMDLIDELERSGKEQLAKLGTLRDQQMKTYEAAHRDRQLLSDMRKEKRGDFQREQTRKEQNLMDDNFSARRSPY